MLTVRKSHERGHFDHGWLDTYHGFSFADYYDPKHMGYRSLRVINEDVVQPGRGFGTHPHRDMEIVTLVLSGALEHKDSLGHGETLRPGELQRITAGTGVLHSEFNPSRDETVHLYQIWLLPERKGLQPGYEQKAFDPAGRRGAWQTVAARDGRGGALTIHQDATLLLADVSGDELRYDFTPGRHGWLQVLKGRVTANGATLGAGDAAALSEEPRLTVGGDGEVLLFDLA